jgi:hypothetical protein
MSRMSDVHFRREESGDNELLEAALRDFFEEEIVMTSNAADQPKVATLSSGAWLRSRFE